MIRQNSTRAVSPVISVILMLGLAVSIAAIASLTAFNLQQGVSQNADVSVNIDTPNDRVTVVENANVDSLSIKDASSAGTTSLGTNAGDSAVYSNNADGGTITITATVDGETQLIRQFEDNSIL